MEPAKYLHFGLFGRIINPEEKTAAIYATRADAPEAADRLEFCQDALRNSNGKHIGAIKRGGQVVPMTEAEIREAVEAAGYTVAAFNII